MEKEKIRRFSIGSVNAKLIKTFTKIIIDPMRTKMNLFKITPYYKLTVWVKNRLLGPKQIKFKVFGMKTLTDGSLKMTPLDYLRRK